MNVTTSEPVADVCLIVEGAYPYVSGGVSSWVQDIITSLAPMTFHVIALRANSIPCESRYQLPDNLQGLSIVALQPNEKAQRDNKSVANIIASLEEPLKNLLSGGGTDDFKQLVKLVSSQRNRVTRSSLLNSEAAFELVQRMYQESVPKSSFLQYFWSWRSLVGGLFSVLLTELPKARLFHAVSTGYAGLLMARASLETERQGILTEHGIYTNERRIEIAMAQWLTDRSTGSLEIEKLGRDLRDIWIDAFASYSRVCYQTSARIITLYRGNQTMQMRDGASPERMMVIPNGIDVQRYANIIRDPKFDRPTVALIGRVVSIKDVKTYIRAIGLLRSKIPNIRALVLGPIDEEPIYFNECQEMVKHLSLTGSVEFLGQIKVLEYLPTIDVVALTSISEAQPLVLLEAGAAGIPVVATDVGACRELIEGEPYETPALGHGGIVTPLANPVAIATALEDLLSNKDLRTTCGAVMRARTLLFYSKDRVLNSYQRIYEQGILGTLNINSTVE
jgi:polysaccharide biosynthesis protein PelF